MQSTHAVLVTAVAFGSGLGIAASPRLTATVTATAATASARRRVVAALATATINVPTAAVANAPRDPEPTIDPASRARAPHAKMRRRPWLESASQVTSGSVTAKSIAVVFGFWPIPR